MRLLDFFTKMNESDLINLLSNEDNENSQIINQNLLKQIRAMVPGQTLQGKIIGNDQGKVQIQIAKDFILAAKLETDVPIYQGKIMTFQVKNNGKNLTLSPLFENLTSDENVMKAIDMAQIPITDRTIKMTESMMKERMAIDKNSLQVMLKSVNAYPNVDPKIIVQLTKLEIPITRESLIQAKNYETMNYKIELGLKQILLDLSNVLDSTEGVNYPISQFFNKMLHSVFEDNFVFENMHRIENNLEQSPQELLKSVIHLSEYKEPTLEQVQEIILKYDKLLENEEMFLDIPEKIRVHLTKNIVKLLEVELENKFSIRPEEIKKEKGVQDFYEKIERVLLKMEDVGSKTIGEHNGFFKSTQQMRGNLDFMNQINQMYHFIQLPLKLNERKAHGDLYVYSDKKNLAREDGSIRAFLHLDMENLGGVDVFVSLKGVHVETCFTLENDAMLSFLNEHMNFLDERLQKRGYALSYEMKVSDKESEDVLNNILHLEQPWQILSQHSFDVRA